MQFIVGDSIVVAVGGIVVRVLWSNIEDISMDT